jgi:hypothetical protein
MFRELSFLREAENKLKNGRFEEALDLIRNPKIADHKRAADVRAAARAALRDEVAACVRDGRFGPAADALAVLKRDGADDAVFEAERVLRDARRDADSASAARDAAMRAARKAVEAGDRAKARELLSNLNDPDAERLLRVADDDERREAAWRERTTAALLSGDCATAEELFDDAPSRGPSPDERRRLLRDVVRAALKKGDAATAAKAWKRAADGDCAPAEFADEVAAAALKAARDRLSEADLAGAGRVLRVFPMNGEHDAEAADLRRSIWAWQRGREAFRRGQDAVGRALYDESDATGPRSPVRDQERADAAERTARLKESIKEARRLSGVGRLVEARKKLADALKDAPSDHVATELLAALDLDLKRDADAAAEAREALASLDLRTARRIAAGLSLRRSDLAEAELLLQEIEARSERALLDAIDAERRVVMAPPKKEIAPRVSGRSPEPGEPFVLRVENEGDWLVYPASTFWIGSAAKKRADMRILAPVGARHLRFDRVASKDGRVDYKIEAGEGHALSVNGVETKAATLSDGDVVRLGRSVAFTFSRPGDAAGSACLKWHGDYAVFGCSRVALFHEAGRGGAVAADGAGCAAHVPLRSGEDRFEVFRAEDGDRRGDLLVRSPRGVAADGDGERAQVRVAYGAVYATGATRFYFDPLPVDRA